MIEFLKAGPLTDAKVWAACSKQILGLADARLSNLGFNRTKPTFFTHEREHWCEFVHVHRFSAGSHYRLHAGIRLFNSSFPACALNGPHSDSERWRRALWFSEDPTSWQRCADAFGDFVSSVAMPWFAELASGEALLGRFSPLGRDEQEALRGALAGDTSLVSVQRSRNLLGLR